MEEERRKENMDRLRKDMEKSGGQTVVLSTGLKDKEEKSGKSMMVEEDDEEEDDDFETLSDNEDFINEDEDEEVAKFSF